MEWEWDLHAGYGYENIMDEQVERGRRRAYSYLIISFICELVSYTATDSTLPLLYWLMPSSL
jgi:hypothetical protein